MRRPSGAIAVAIAAGACLAVVRAQDKPAKPLPSRLEVRYPVGQKLTWHMELAYRQRVAAHEGLRMDQRADIRETVLATSEKDPHRVLWERLDLDARVSTDNKSFAYEDDGKDAPDRKADFVALAGASSPFERSYEYELARGSLQGLKVERFTWIHDVKPPALGAWAEGVRVQQERGAQRFNNRPIERGASWSVAEDDEPIPGGTTLKRTTTYTVMARELFDGRHCVRLATRQEGRLEGKGKDPIELSACTARGEVVFDLELGNVARETLRTDVVLKRQLGAPPSAFEDERTLDFRLVLLPRDEPPAAKDRGPKKDTKKDPKAEEGGD